MEIDFVFDKVLNFWDLEDIKVKCGEKKNFFFANGKSIADVFLPD